MNNNKDMNQFEGITLDHHEGYLYMQNYPTLGMLHNVWKKRYVTLKNGFLYFTEKKGDLIFHETTNKLELKSSTQIYQEDSHESEGKYYLRIIQHTKYFTFYTTNEDERNKWLSSVLTAMTQTYIKSDKKHNKGCCGSKEDEDESPLLLRRTKTLCKTVSAFLKRRGNAQ